MTTEEDEELDVECGECGTNLIMTQPEGVRVCPSCLVRR